MTAGALMLRGSALCLGLGLLTGCQSLAESEQSRAASRVVDIVADAVAFPRQTSSQGLVRAIQATSAGASGQVQVIDAEDLHAPSLDDPVARIEVIVHVPESGEGFTHYPAFTACFDLWFGRYGVTDDRRVDCPAHPTPVPTPPPVRHDAIATGSDESLRRVLEALPAAPSSEVVVSMVRSALPHPEVDPGTGLPNSAPQVRAVVDGGDVGVAVWAADSRTCLVGVNRSGQVSVGRLASEQVAPGEGTCDGQAALAASTPAAPTRS